MFALVLSLPGCNWGTGTGTFTIVQTYKDGHVLFATIDTSLGGRKDKASLPWLLSISTRLNNPTKDGLTTDDEATALNGWEDALEKEFSGVCRFAYFGRVTWNGTRELLYYVDTPDAIVAKLNKLGGDPGRKAFSVRSERDEQWKKVSFYLGLPQAGRHQG